MIPDLSVFLVIGFVLIASVVFDRLLVRPLMRVMQEREGVVRSARDAAETAAAQARTAAAEVDTRTREARSGVYSQMERSRREALERRAALLAETRHEAEAALQDASARMKTEAADARAQLDRNIDTLADQMAERILGRKAS